MPKKVSFLFGFVLVLLLVMGLLGTAVFIPIVYAETITVNTTDDEVNSDGDCSLREAILSANTNTAVDACEAGDGDDIISIPAGTYILSISGAGEDAAQTGDLDLTADVTIIGADMFTTLIDASNIDRIFDVHNGTAVTISNLTMQNGMVDGNGGGININFGGELTLTSSLLVGNVATGSGGGIMAFDRLTLHDSRLDGNVAGSAGGGILVSFNPVLITNSQISGNSSNNSGGGIYSSGTLNVVNSTLSDNSSNQSGGGLYTVESVANSLYNVTVTNNRADADGTDDGNGGGISIQGGATLANTIISGNSDSGATIHPDCSGTVTSEGYNLVNNINGCTIAGDTTGNQTGVDPLLDSLQNNGGNTLTHALQTGSPAIDAGNPGGCLDHNDDLLTDDQRGFTRPGGSTGLCDMGAYETDGTGAPPTVTPTPPTVTPTATPVLDEQTYLPLILKE